MPQYSHCGINSNFRVADVHNNIEFIGKPIYKKRNKERKKETTGLVAIISLFFTLLPSSILIVNMNSSNCFDLLKLALCYQCLLM